MFHAVFAVPLILCRMRMYLLLNVVLLRIKSRYPRGLRLMRSTKLV